jgi:outer membrane lipoprotein SlyB
MLHHTKFPLFAFLALLCAAVSGCTTSRIINSDPNTAADILEASTEHPALITLKNGDTITCNEIAVRKDSTQWRRPGKWVSVPTDSVASISGDRTLVTLINGSAISCCDADYTVQFGKKITAWRAIADVSVPTDSVASIRVANPQPGAIALGVIAGGVLGGIIGNALFVPTPSTPYVINFNQLAQGFAIVLGALSGAGVGVGLGSIISSNSSTLYTSDRGRVLPDTAVKSPGSATNVAIPPTVKAPVPPDTRIKKWVPDGYSTGFSSAGHWEFIPHDTISSHDTAQTKLPH